MPLLFKLSDASNSDLEPTHDSEMVQALKTSEGNLFRTILLLIALSFHTIFDGLAVGLISGVASVWQVSHGNVGPLVYCNSIIMTVNSFMTVDRERGGVSVTVCTTKRILFTSVLSK